MIKKELQVSEFLEPILDAFKAIVDGGKPKYRQYKLCTARYTGKTYTTMMLASLILLKAKNVAVVIMRKTFQDATNSMKEIISGTRDKFDINVNLNMTLLSGDVNGNYLRGVAVNGDKQKGHNYKLGQETFYNTKYIIEIYDETHVIDEELALHASSSFRFDHADGIKLKFYFSNPWVATNWFVKEVMDATGWDKEMSENAITGKGKNFIWKADGDTLYGSANIFANTLLPLDIQREALSIKDLRTKDIYVHGLAGALTGLVYTNSSLMPDYIDFDRDYDFLVAGIDIGWTKIDKSGGATVLQVFKYSLKYGFSGIFEYYHHNKNGMIPEKEQRMVIVRKLAEIFKREGKHIFVTVDGGQGNEVANYFWQELQRHNRALMKYIIFTNMTARDKTLWINYDRAIQIDFLLSENKIYLHKDIQPNLYNSIMSATWKDTSTLSEGVLPEREHKFTDVLNAMEYAFHKVFRNSWLKWGFDEMAKR